MNKFKQMDSRGQAQATDTELNSIHQNTITYVSELTRLFLELKFSVALSVRMMVPLVTSVSSQPRVLMESWSFGDCNELVCAMNLNNIIKNFILFETLVCVASFCLPACS
jgi:hypothetical protein